MASSLCVVCATYWPLLPQNGDNCSSPIWPGPELIYATSLSPVRRSQEKMEKKMEKTVAKSQVNFLSTQTQKAMKCSLL